MLNEHFELANIRAAVCATQARKKSLAHYFVERRSTCDSVQGAAAAQVQAIGAAALHRAQRHAFNHAAVSAEDATILGIGRGSAAVPPAPLHLWPASALSALQQLTAM